MKFTFNIQTGQSAIATDETGETLNKKAKLTPETQLEIIKETLKAAGKIGGAIRTLDLKEDNDILDVDLSVSFPIATILETPPLPLPEREG